MNKQCFFIFIFLCLACLNLYSQNTDSVVIYFDIDKSKIENHNVEILKSLSQTENIKDIKISAYTDFLGSDEHNLTLSRKRAYAIKDFLISQGIKSEIISEINAKGIYDKNPVQTLLSDDDRGIQKHRKAIVIYSLSEPEIIITEKVIKEEEEVVVIPIFSQEIENQIKEGNLQPGKNIVLNQIIFFGGTPLFKPESEKSLAELMHVMIKYPELEIEVQGHICCQTDDEGDGWDQVNQNNRLSENRAKAVYDYLIENGIDKNRMTYKGYASRHKRYPLERNSFEQEQNRRVEIRIQNL